MILQIKKSIRGKGGSLPVSKYYGKTYELINPGIDLQKYAYRLASKLHELRGKHLACYCPLDKQCHADVLLEIANK